jgi:hypothetical protein
MQGKLLRFSLMLNNCGRNNQNNTSNLCEMRPTFWKKGSVNDIALFVVDAASAAGLDSPYGSEAAHPIPRGDLSCNESR